MRTPKSRTLIAFAAAALVGALVVTAAPAGAADTRTYEVTITNLTGGQPFTPPVVATHRRATGVFEVGATASLGVREVAENGNLTPLLDALAADKHVSDVFVGSVPLVPAGTPGGTTFPDTTTFTIDAAMGAKHLSWASMLVCTNDGFTGIDSIRLPQHVGDSVTVTTDAYDAGSEINTEDFADIVPPCQGLIGVSSGDPGTGTSDPGLAEGGVIAPHGGVVGGVDLVPAIHGWADPVATVTIERVS